MKIVRVVGTLVGLFVIAYLVREVGWETVRRSLGLLRWGYLVVLIYPASWMLCNTQGWRYALHARYARIPLIELARTRLAGEVFNTLLPSGYVGGEPVKARLLAVRVPFSEAISSVLIAKAAQSVSLIPFIGIGLTMGTRHGESGATQASTLVALVVLSGGVSLFVWLLTRRSFARLGRWLHRLSRHPWFARQEGRLMTLDDSIGAFYREGKWRFLKSVAWHGAAWLAGAMEVALIFALLGRPIPWESAWFIGAMAQLAAIIGLFVPAGVGLFEGGHYVAASMLGLPPGLGFSVSLIRRVRELCWNALGLYLFWRLSKNLNAARVPAVRPDVPA